MLAVREHVGYLAFLAQIVLYLERGEVDFLVFAVHLLDHFVQGRESAAEVEVVQKSVFLVPHIDESGIQPSHHFVDFAEIDIADGERAFGLLPVEFDELPVFQQGDVYFGPRGVDY